ncbi:ABC transporter ATP-binding protein [Parafrankia sp. FMc6]|uniref:ABC transporter ATP-binding protein n=1 Tax=Parafrankia soli TaxID=2599596 RepID=UPI0034D6F68B
MSDPEQSGPPTAVGALRRLLAPLRGRLMIAVVFQAVSGVAAVVPLAAVAEVVRMLLAPPVDEGSVWVAVAVCGAAAPVSLLAGTAAVVVTHLGDVTLQLALRRELARRLGGLPLGWFSARGSGAVKKAVHDDVHALHYLVAHTVLDVTTVVVVPVAAVGYLVAVDWRLGLLSLVPLLAGCWLFARAMAGAGSKMAEYGHAVREINQGVVEFVDGIAVVKTFGRARAAHERFLQATDAFHTFFSRWAAATTPVTTASQIVSAPPVPLLLALTVGTALVTSDQLAAPDLVAFALLSPGVAGAVSGIGTRLQALRTGGTAATGVVSLLDTPGQPRTAQPRRPDGVTVRLRGVAFGYGERTVLRGVELDLVPGTVTALVGRSGAGKSTLARLLPRFHDVTAGSVSLGGVDVRDLDPEDLYRAVGFVFQETTLLRMSVADNIALGRPEASRARVEEAARRAMIHDRIRAEPRGYDAVVGTDVEFSGGEAQRIAIARALLADPPVLILDEATAYTDPHAEAAIQQALSAAAAGRTLLVIAHRLASVTGADQIVVLADGVVAERGRHEDLLALDGHYARLWRAQQPAVAGAPTARQETTP